MLSSGFNTDLQNDFVAVGDEVWWAGEHRRQSGWHYALSLQTEESAAASFILSCGVNL